MASGSPYVSHFCCPSDRNPGVPGSIPQLRLRVSGINTGAYLPHAFTIKPLRFFEGELEDASEGRCYFL